MKPAAPATAPMRTAHTPFDQHSPNPHAMFNLADEAPLGAEGAFSSHMVYKVLAIAGVGPKHAEKPQPLRQRLAQQRLLEAIEAPAPAFPRILLPALVEVRTAC